MKLLKPIYDLCDSGDFWHKTPHEHHHHDLGITPLRSDQEFYSLLRDCLLDGLSGGYVDDILRAGTQRPALISSLRYPYWLK